MKTRRKWLILVTKRFLITFCIY